MTRRISSINIKNFRPYNDVDVGFPYNEKGDISVIIGGNRVGKTNFLNSLLWCLYGEDGLYSEGSDSSANFIKNERYPSGETKVSITLNDNKGNKDIIKRNEDSFIINKKESGKYVPKEDFKAEAEIKKILPKSIRNLFIFKGEFLNNFFENRGNNELSTTIKNASKINELEKVEKVLENLEKEYREEIKKQNRNNKKIENCNNNLEKIDDLIKRDQKRLNNVLGYIKNKKSEISNIDNQLKNMNEEKIDDLMERESTYEQEKNKSYKKINENKTKIVDFFKEEASRWFLYKGVEDFNNYTGKLRKEDLLPPPIRPEMIKELLKKKECICGKKIDKDMDNELNKLLKKYPENNRMEMVHSLSFSFDMEKNKFSRIRKRIKDLINENYEEDKSLENVNKKLNQVREELEGMDKTRINRLATKRKTFLDEIDSLEMERRGLEREIDKLNNERDVFNNEMQRHLSKSNRSPKISKKFDICSKIRKRIKEISEKILKDISEEINKSTQEYFRNIFWENYRSMDYNININDNFEVEVISPKGNNMMDHLSTGEKKVLALSFIAALSDFYGFDFPIIIDAPFTALQKEVTSKMLDTLLHLSKRKQIIILTIPHDKTIMKKLLDSSTQIYYMKKDKEDNTKLEENNNGYYKIR